MVDDEVTGHLAKELWKAFEYTLPISPRQIAEFVIQQIENAGFKIIKIGGNDDPFL